MTALDIRDIIVGDRTVTADQHAASGRAWFNAGRDTLAHSPLLYSAFEFRCAIERVVLEFYVITKALGPGLEEGEFEKVGTMKGLMHKVRSLAGGKGDRLHRYVRFNSIVSESMGLPRTLAEPSLGKLHGFWDRLSSLCHAQLDGDTSWDSTEWLGRGYALLEEVNAYFNYLFVEHYFGTLVEENTPPEVLALKVEFLDGGLTEEQVRTRLKLMEPALASRPRPPQRDNEG